MTKSNETEFQAAIKRYCEKHNMSWRKLSLMAGYSESYVKNIMRGQSKNPRSDTLKNLYAVIEASPPALTPAEKALLDKYRLVSDEGKAAAQTLLDVLPKSLDADDDDQDNQETG